jgi:uncharacterized membrane protein
VKVERVLYVVLLVGMVLSTSLFVLGLVAYAVPSVQGYSETILMVATMILLATPVTRAFLGAIVFALHGEMRSSLVAWVVSLVLFLSVILGFVLHFQI